MMTKGERKAAAFVAAINVLQVLKGEIEEESTTNPPHVQLAARIDAFCDELLQAAGEKR